MMEIQVIMKYNLTFISNSKNLAFNPLSEAYLAAEEAAPGVGLPPGHLRHVGGHL